MKPATGWLADLTGKPAARDGETHQVRLAKGVVFQLHMRTLHGVPDCYGKRKGEVRTPRESKAAFKESLLDLWMDLPWDDSRDESIRFILNDEVSAAVLDNIKEVFDFDMRREFRKGLSTSRYMRKHT